MRKRLWLIFGPLLCAVLLILVVILAANTQPKSNYKVERKAATATSPRVFKSAILKQQALSDKQHRFVPFFGSSEWKRMDAMHPSTLAEGYHRSYRPFLLGQSGSTALTHYFGMQQMLPQIQNKQAVFVISPQWFIKNADNPQAFSIFYSTGQGLDFLKNQTGTKADRFAAQRFLKVAPQGSINQMMKKVANGKSLTPFEKHRINAQLSLVNHEDAFFSKWRIEDNYNKKILPESKKLPQPYNREKLGQVATHLGQQSTTNNRFGIDNTFYNKRVRQSEKGLAGKQKSINYESSVEYNDFQLVLEQFAQSNTNVMFVIPPVNHKWVAYTGLNEGMYQRSVKKIEYQLRSQGFNNVVDLSKDGNKPYFMQDTIHLGWNGWLAMDDHVDPFLTQKQAQPKYKINDKFFDAAWANYRPTASDNFSKFKQ
ncbi:D-alanyl-lipoteichoic acid biosynthesis protein DltD [Weissella viridescens]|uniref:Protein DltD n=1 Tax=Weissella viridescens TaxID=1629 RepID=A0A3P2RIU7_WEIVI|nr:D-alanyl-lipoteichoic acid biosynthesis protein DltD [Weissella viridescens]RRG17642.1 D-alanyl-lipoteichoic acid biosynthesis protein DltD [Weissella viridescens]